MKLGAARDQSPIAWREGNRHPYVPELWNSPYGIFGTIGNSTE